MKISFNLPNMRKISFPAINQVILIMTIAEFVFAISVAFITPVFALFVVNDIKAPVAAAGFSVAVYWGIKSILQLPIARYLDKNHGEIDDFYSMIGGLFIMACVQYFYYFVGSEWQIYLLQSLMAVGNAFVTPPFLAIFSRHIDKDKEGRLTFLYVKRNYRKKGIGEELTKKRISWLKSRKIKRIESGIYLRNKPSINNLKKAGFKPISIKLELKIK